MSCAASRKPTPTSCMATAPKAAPMPALPSTRAARCAPIRRMAAACCSATTVWPERFYLATERLLMLRGDLFLFESAYSADVFRRKIGNPRGLVRIVHNGVSRAEFEPIGAARRCQRSGVHGRTAAVKGVDVLIEAIAHPATRRPHRDRDAGRRRPRARHVPARKSSGWASATESASSPPCRRARR